MRAPPAIPYPASPLPSTKMTRLPSDTATAPSTKQSPYTASTTLSATKTARAQGVERGGDQEVETRSWHVAAASLFVPLRSTGWTSGKMGMLPRQAWKGTHAV